MPSIKQTVNTSGLVLWNEQVHKKGILEGLKIDNQSIYDQTIKLYDCFTTDASKTNAAGATQAAEDFSTIVASGKIRFQMTIPAGQAQSFAQEDLRECTFLGKAYVVGPTTTSDCVVIAQYSLR